MTLSAYKVNQTKKMLRQTSLTENEVAVRCNISLSSVYRISKKMTKKRTTSDAATLRKIILGLKTRGYNDQEIKAYMNVIHSSVA